MKFKLTFTGRESGAIGRSSPMQITCESKTDLTKLSQHDLYRHSDVLFLWDTWEHISNLRAERLTEN